MDNGLREKCSPFFYGMRREIVVIMILSGGQVYNENTSFNG